MFTSMKLATHLTPKLRDSFVEITFSINNVIFMKILQTILYFNAQDNYFFSILGWNMT